MNNCTWPGIPFTGRSYGHGSWHCGYLPCNSSLEAGRVAQSSLGPVWLAFGTLNPQSPSGCGFQPLEPIHACAQEVWCTEV